MQKTLLNNLHAVALIGLTAFTTTTQAQTTVSIEADAPLIAYANWFELDGTTYVAGSEWSVEALKTVVNTGNNTLTLHPNFSAYADEVANNPSANYWHVGNIGNKIFEGNTYIQDNSLIGQTVTFEGSTISNTLAEGYEGVAFIKVLSADYQLLQHLQTPLVAGQNFSLVSNTASIAGATHFQYGYSVTGLNANPAQETALGNAVVTSETSGVDPTGTVVTIDTASPLIAYANWFELDGTTYVAGSEWSVEALQTVVNTQNNTLALHPNFSAYEDEVTNNPSANYWHVGEIGNKVFEGNTYVQDDSLLGEMVTFTGNTISNTLATGYTGIAFIKVLSADYQLLQFLQTPLVAGEDFTLTSDMGSISGAAHFQYGYSVKGLNANPDQETALGFALVTSNTLSANTFTRATSALYPNPAENVINIAANEVITNISIYSILGQKVLEKNSNSSTVTLDVSSLNSGLYIVNTTCNGQVHTTRFVKK